MFCNFASKPHFIIMYFKELILFICVCGGVGGTRLGSSHLLWLVDGSTWLLPMKVTYLKVDSCVFGNSSSHRPIYRGPSTRSLLVNDYNTLWHSEMFRDTVSIHLCGSERRGKATSLVLWFLIFTPKVEAHIVCSWFPVFLSLFIHPFYELLIWKANIEKKKTCVSFDPLTSRTPLEFFRWVLK